MKNLLILATMLLTFGFANAQSRVWSSYNGSSSIKDKCVGFYEGGKIWTSYNGSSSIKDKCVGFYEGGETGGGAAALLLLL